MLNFVEISHRIENPSMIKLEDLEELHQLAKRYPFTAIFSQLYLKGLALHNTIQFESELKNHAYKIPDRAQLFYLVHSVQENIHQVSSIPEIIPEGNHSIDFVEDVVADEKEAMDAPEVDMAFEESKLEVSESIEEESEEKLSPETVEEVKLQDSTFEVGPELNEETICAPLDETSILPDLKLVDEETALIDESNDGRVEEEKQLSNSFSDINESVAAGLEKDPSDVVNETIAAYSEHDLESAINVSENTEEPKDIVHEENLLSADTETESDGEENRAKLSKKLKNVSDLDRDILAHAVSSSIFIEVDESEADIYSFEKLRKLDRSEMSGEENYNDEIESTSITFDLPSKEEGDDFEIEEKENSEIETSLDSNENKKSFTSWLSSFIPEENTQKPMDKSVDLAQKEVKLAKKVEEKEKNKEILASEKRKSEFFSPIKKARESLDESRLPVSETLAKVYSAQGNYPKAIEAYEKLLLKFPEKKSFFALQIETLKRKLN